MREIKFRSRFVEDNQWYYFTLADVAKLGDAFGNYRDWSQFTGILSKNGREIWEGDIMRLPGSKYQIVQFADNFYEDGNCYGYDGELVRNGEVIGTI